MEKNGAKEIELWVDYLLYEKAASCFVKLHFGYYCIVEGGVIVGLCFFIRRLGVDYLQVGTDALLVLDFAYPHNLSGQLHVLLLLLEGLPVVAELQLRRLNLEVNALLYEGGTF